MNTEIKAKWLATLRDPEAKQTRGALNRVRADDEDPERWPEGQCCLGVLCEIAVAEGVIPPGKVDRTGKVQYEDPYIAGDGELIPGTEAGVLPLLVRDWAALPESNPCVPLEGDRLKSLASINDGGATFAEIADIIDKEF